MTVTSVWWTARYRRMTGATTWTSDVEIPDRDATIKLDLPRDIFNLPMIAIPTVMGTGLVVGGSFLAQDLTTPGSTAGAGFLVTIGSLLLGTVVTVLVMYACPRQDTTVQGGR